MERLLLALRVDKTIRSLKVDNIPIQTSLSQKDLKGLVGRSYSTKYKALIQALRPSLSESNIATGAIDIPFTSIKAKQIRDAVSNAIKNKDVLDQQLERLKTSYTTPAKDKTEMETVTESGGSKGSPKTDKPSTTVIQIIQDLWKTSGIIKFMADARSVAADTMVTENAHSLVATWNHWFAYKHRPESIFSEYAERFTVGSGANKNKVTPGTGDISETINRFEYMQLKTAAVGKGFDIKDVIDYMKNDAELESEEKDAISDWVTIFTDLELLHCGENLKTFFSKHIKESDTTMAYSDNKDLNMIMMEAERAQSLQDLKLFCALQAWVALAQITLKGVYRPEINTYIKTHIPNLSATYDMEGLINTFMKLPVGPNVADLLAKYPDVAAIKTGGSAFTAFTANDITQDGDNLMLRTAAFMKELIPFLHAFMSNKDLWDIYAKGATLFGAKPLAFQTQTRDIDSVPVTFAQYGVMTGDRVNTLDDINWSCIFDWGINRFNSSARTLVRWNDTNTDDLAIPYSYGTIDFRKYLIERDATISKASISGSEITGYQFSRLNVVALPFRKRVTSTRYEDLYLDKFLLDVGPVSLLPVEPRSIIPIDNSATITKIAKDSVGTYETKLDKMQLEILHMSHNDGQNGDISGTILPETLGISQESFTRAVSLESLLLRRFVKNDAQDKVVCKAITKDALFVDMVNCFYYIPNTYMDKEISMVWISLSLGTDSGNHGLDQVTRVRKVGARRILTSPVDSTIAQVPGRLVGSTMYFDNLFSLPQGPDDIVMNINK